MLAELTNHIWQSTIVALVAGLITLTFRRHRAQVRYWLWLSASFKFLLPFSCLMSLGSQFESVPQKISAAPQVSLTLVEISQPFSSAVPVTAVIKGTHESALLSTFGIWMCGFAAVTLLRYRGWRRIREAIKSGTPIHIHAPIEIRSVPGLLEPGVVGLFRPVLLMPASITERLKPSQLEAVLAHEVCHVRRRDNLTAAVHMIVEAIFWFHPLVWWIGARLIEERERACDEAVLSLGSTPRDYAEGILNVFKSYLESPLACVSGVTGANLKKRIQTILNGGVPRHLSLARKLALTVAGLTVLTLPIAVGIVGAPEIRAVSQLAKPKSEAQATPSNPSTKPITLQSLELKSGRRPVPGFRDRARSTLYPGYYHIDNASLRDLIEGAYMLRDFQIVSGPPWIDSHDYAVTAKATGVPSLELRGALGPNFQALLHDRFKLKFHYETRKQPVYVLITATGGNKLRAYKEHNCGSFQFTGYPDRRLENECGAVSAVNEKLNMQLDAVGMKMTGTSRDEPGLTDILSGRLGRPVLDETGLIGRYDFRLEWNEAATSKALGQLATGANDPSMFAALQDQLGLELKADEGPVKVLAVDHAERPALR